MKDMKDMKDMKKIIYFTKETEDWIIKYNNTANPIDKNRIYEDHIHLALSKLVENVYNTFKFIYISPSSMNDQQDCLSHLVMNLSKFDSKKGYKAFSFFSVCCKHYFIQLNKKGYENKKRNITIDNDIDEDGVNVLKEIEMDKADKDESKFDMKLFCNSLASYFEKNKEEICKSFHSRNKAIGNHILDVVVVMLRDTERYEYGFNDLKGSKNMKSNTYGKLKIFDRIHGELQQRIDNYNKRSITDFLARFAIIYKQLLNKYKNYGILPMDEYNEHIPSENNYSKVTNVILPEEIKVVRYKPTFKKTRFAIESTRRKELRKMYINWQREHPEK